MVHPVNDTLNADLLAAALRRYADGSLALVAAIALLISHRTWLTKPEFVQLVTLAGDHPDGGPLYGRVRWDKVRHLLDERDAPASGSEWAVLDVVHSLAAGDLRRAADTCDTRNAALVAGSVATAMGLREMPRPRPAI